ncbi:MAG: hypothetical protein HC905_20610 [Bacteroidales bacterium]|nr:hypothetical protein [Bacteroidales bacterium]
MDWIEFINERESSVDKTDLEYYSFFFDIGDLIGLWKLSQSKFGLHNFVLFFYYFGTKIFNSGLKINKKVCRNELLELLNSKNLLEILENEFFSVEESDKDYSAKSR